MADTSTNKFTATGTTAERTAFTPSPGTPTPTPAQGYTWWDTDDQTLYAYDFGAAAWVATGGGGGGGNTTSTGTEAAIPAAGTAGNLYLPSNGFWLQRDSGSAWVPWGPLFPMTDPALAAISTWVNQGSATVTTTNGGIYLTTPAQSGDNVRALVKSAPATPYTITIAFIPQMGNVAYLSCGFVWRASGSGAVVTAAAFYDGNFVVQKWNSATSFNSDYGLVGNRSWGQGVLVFMKLTDDGSNRTVSVSFDGQNWKQIESVGRTDFMTADQVGIFVAGNNAFTTNESAMTLLSWKES